jgi:uncharacterized protein (DUF924 family)
MVKRRIIERHQGFPPGAQAAIMTRSPAKRQAQGSVDRSILREIHRYWFGDLKSPDGYPAEKSKIWFNRSDETDEHIRLTFGPYIPEAAEERWDLASLSREEAIALVVLLDQFPRNIFRESGEAFAFDFKAREIARHLIAMGKERFYWIERSFLYLPLEHSEHVADQDESVLLYAELAVSGPDNLSDTFRYHLDFATKHRDLIRRFGRFPHRNVMLGRQSTPEEEAFVKEHGRGY